MSQAPPRNRIHRREVYTKISTTSKIARKDRSGSRQCFLTFSKVDQAVKAFDYEQNTKRFYHRALWMFSPALKGGAPLDEYENIDFPKILIFLCPVSFSLSELRGLPYSAAMR